jgi:hypothetical protein
VPEPKVVNKPLSKSEVGARKSPIYPSPGHQKEAPLVREVKKVSETRRAVHFHKPDTGYALIYHFERFEGCWKLVEFEDQST